MWHFPQSKTGLSQDYVNTWLKIKDEASGWPEGCETSEQRQQHLQAYEIAEGIQLNPDAVAYNANKFYSFSFFQIMNHAIQITSHLARLFTVYLILQLRFVQVKT